MFSRFKVKRLGTIQPLVSIIHFPLHFFKFEVHSNPNTESPSSKLVHITAMWL